MLKQTKIKNVLQTRDVLAIIYIIDDMYYNSHSRLARKLKKYFTNLQKKGQITMDDAWICVSAIYYENTFIANMEEEWLDYLDILMDSLDEYVVANHLQVADGLKKLVGEKLYYSEV